MRTNRPRVPLGWIGLAVCTVMGSALLLSTQQGLLSQASAPRTLAVVAATRDWNGAIPLVPAFPTPPSMICSDDFLLTNLGRVVLEATP